MTEGKIKIVFADQTNISKYPAGVAKVLAALGHAEAAVSDLSQVFDFFPGVSPDLLAEADRVMVLEIEEAKLNSLAHLLGRTVKAGEYIWQLGQEVEN